MAQPALRLRPARSGPYGKGVAFRCHGRNCTGIDPFLGLGSSDAAEPGDSLGRDAVPADLRAGTPEFLEKHPALAAKLDLQSGPALESGATQGGATLGG